MARQGHLLWTFLLQDFLGGRDFPGEALVGFSVEDAFPSDPCSCLLRPGSLSVAGLSGPGR